MSSVRRVSPKEAKEMQDQGYVYVDVRSIPEFENGHPSGAINIPLQHRDPSRGMFANPDFLRVCEANLRKDQPIVIGCLSGNRSMRAAELLQNAGYQNIVEQRAGYGGAKDPFGDITEAGWADAGLPVSRGGNSYAQLLEKK